MLQRLMLAAVLATSSYALAQRDADNSETNERVQRELELDAQDQGTSKGDIALTAKIRNTIFHTKDLSTNAKNIKIITVDRKVTLKGPVKNTTEKIELEKIARRIAGNNNVTSDLEIE